MARSRACSTGSRIPYTAFRRSRLRARHGQGRRQGDVRRRRPADRARPRGADRRTGSRRSAAAALRGEAGRTRAPRSASRSSGDGDNRRAEVARAWRFGNAALVEEYIPGRELTVGVMGDRALAVTEIIADAGVFYDYESKYADGGSRHIIPARVHPDMYDRALDVALAAHRALGCRGATRCRLPLRRHVAANPAASCCWRSTRSPASRRPRCCRNRRRISA